MFVSRRLLILMICDVAMCASITVYFQLLLVSAIRTVLYAFAITIIFVNVLLKENL